MAKIKPFKALRPAEEQVSEVAALPYDVYDRKEARVEALAHPHSFLNIDRAETQFDESVDIYADCVYEKADQMIRQWTEEGIFTREEKECYYIYALTMNGRRQSGLVALSSVDDYLNNTIKKHENTREDKELDRIHHVDTTSCQTGPIFLAYRKDADIDSVVRTVQKTEPLYDFTAEDGIRHQVWRIDDDCEICFVTGLFSDVPNTYIADGHHRAASAVKVALKRREEHPDYTGKEEFNYFLSVLFPDDQLRIYDYNRVVNDLNGLTEKEFLLKLNMVYEIAEASSEGPYRPKEKGECGMFLGGKWYCISAREEIRSTDPIKGLDVSLLQDHVLGPILGIDNPKTNPRIAFVGGIRGLGELEKRVQAGAAVAFSMFPTSMKELFAVADNDLTMPPKSTWFEPKLRSGLFLHPFEK